MWCFSTPTFSSCCNWVQGVHIFSRQPHPLLCGSKYNSLVNTYVRGAWYIILSCSLITTLFIINHFWFNGTYLKLNQLQTVYHRIWRYISMTIVARCYNKNSLNYMYQCLMWFSSHLFEAVLYVVRNGQNEWCRSIHFT